MKIPCRNLTISSVTIKEIGTKFIRDKNHEKKEITPSENTLVILSAGIGEIS
jgi:hypothetical protein